jgi:hypothetical protein
MVPDVGSVWTARTLPTATWTSVAYGNGTFVAVATNLIATSADGITWASTTLTGAWTAVAHNGVSGSGSVFVAVANGGTVAATSSDGVTWATHAITTALWRSVVYGNGTFVAVAGNSAAATTSTNGVTWAPQTLPGAAANWYSVAYGNVGGTTPTFVAISGGGSPGTIAATSPDGATWTARTLPTTAAWTSVAYGNGTFVAISGSASTVAASSTDGITWIARTLPTSNWNSVVYGNGTFVAVGGGTVAATSPDGVTWLSRTLPGASNNWSSVAYGNVSGTTPTFATVGSTTVAATSTSLISADFYTAQTTNAVVTGIVLSNTGAATSNVSVSLAGQQLLSSYQLLTLKYVAIPIRQVLNTGDKVTVTSTIAGVNAVVSGLEIA